MVVFLLTGACMTADSMMIPLSRQARLLYRIRITSPRSQTLPQKAELVVQKGSVNLEKTFGHMTSLHITYLLFQKILPLLQWPR